MNIANLLVRAGRIYPDLTGVALGPQRWASYRELAERAACLAAALRARFKLAPGDRIALTLTNCPQYVELMFAAWHAGLIVVPVNAKLHPREFHYILEHSGARLCFVTIGLASTIAPLAALPGLDAIIDVESREYSELLRTEPLEIVHRSPDDIAWLFYTSGTTGRPKGAMLTHRNLLAMTTSYFIDVDTVAPGDAILHAAPMSHGSGAYILPNVAAGAAQVIPESGHFDPAEIFALIAAHRGVSFFAAPTMVKRLVESTSASHADTAHLKTIVYGGGPMYVQDCKHAMEVLGNRLAQIYGQGECPMTITALSKARHAQRSHPRYLERLGSVGTAHTVVEVRVADRDDRSLPAGETGEVLVRGDPVMRGYWQDAEASAHALRGGWLHTGDVGVLDQDGFLTLKDRSKDLIISGGANIYPREVEETLLLHPAVTEASVVGAPHAEWGEEVVAFVVRRPDAWLDEAALDALCLEYIARFKRPKRYVFVDALPKNNYGKVLKSVLREQLSRSQAQQ